ncbi:sensor domain-containing diguanylate cyclase [Motiliproteus sp. SC1-56]|uniref:sensor domain-containing diguanylate cyclase n=1 Tax=Motiliproteus sp. SC1-56 TaxID=2799565 RepID=UPI001A8D5416|nr:sensor domain-containing diguanylate cyclase [Motiliproteus sp. SC1-56]
MEPSIPNGEDATSREQSTAPPEASAPIYTPNQTRFERIAQVAERLFQVPSAAVALFADRTPWFQPVPAGADTKDSPRGSCIARTLTRGNTLVIEDARQDPSLAYTQTGDSGQFIGFFAGHPIYYENRPVGAFYITDTSPRAFSDEEQGLLSSLAAWAESELRLSAMSEAQAELLREKSEAERHTLVDPLTKLWNRNGMEYLLTRELSAAQRKQLSIAVMLIDLDNFATLKARHGESAATATLKEVAARIRASVRPHDVLVRYGEDRYLLFAADCTQEIALQLADRMLNRVRSQHINDGKRYFSTSVSIGGACTQAKRGQPINALLQNAAQALKDAQAAGRDCARVHSF